MGTPQRQERRRLMGVAGHITVKAGGIWLKPKRVELVLERDFAVRNRTAARWSSKEIPHDVPVMVNGAAIQDVDGRWRVLRNFNGGQLKPGAAINFGVRDLELRLDLTDRDEVDERLIGQDS
jgi:hypothetical protein